MCDLSIFFDFGRDFSYNELMEIDQKNKFIGKISLAMILLFAGFLGLKLAFGFSLIIYIPLAIAALIMSIAVPAAGLTACLVLTIVFANYFSLQGVELDATVYKFYLPDILLIGSYVGLLARLVKGRITLRWRWPETLLIAFIILTFLYFILSIAVLDGQFALAFSSFKNYAFYPLIYFAVYLAFPDKAGIKQLAYFAFGACLAIIFFIVYGVAAGKGLWTDITPLTTSGNRLLDFDHAFYLGLANIAGLSYLIFGKQIAWKKVWLWLLPVFIFGVVGSLMRHLWIAGLAALGFMFALPVMRGRQEAKRAFADYLVSGTAIILMVLLAVNLFPNLPFSQKLYDIKDQTVERMFSLANSQDTSFTWRSSVWESAWWQYRNNLLMGIGFGQKVFVEMPDYLDYVEVRNVHNSFLAVAVQMGLISFGILSAFLLWLFVGLLKRLYDWPLANSALACMMVFCFIAFLFQPYLEANFFNIVFWTLLGLSRRTYEGLTG